VPANADIIIIIVIIIIIMNHASLAICARVALRRFLLDGLGGEGGQWQTGIWGLEGKVKERGRGCRWHGHCGVKNLNSTLFQYAYHLIKPFLIGFGVKHLRLLVAGLPCHCGKCSANVVPE
jgi:hypothetical protein